MIRLTNVGTSSVITKVVANIIAWNTEMLFDTGFKFEHLRYEI